MTNTTDLHIQYKLETGESHQWPYGKLYNAGRYHETEGYSREYAKWIEEIFINLSNNKESEKEEIIILNNEIEKLKKEIIDQKTVLDDFLSKQAINNGYY